MGYIYKITNIVSGKLYIGETKLDPDQRWKRHIASLKQKGGCPALKDAIRKYGVDKFKFEIIIICFDEDRLQMEREYIKRFNCMVPNGYNILEGGQSGGGFKGKKHSQETKNKIKECLKEYYAKNPHLAISIANHNKEYMKNIDSSKITLTSHKYQLALAEGRVGAKKVPKEAIITPKADHRTVPKEKIIKQKISNSLKIYNNNAINIDKHRDIMAKSVGKAVNRCDKDGVIHETYPSIKEASRKISVTHNALQRVLKGDAHLTCCGWYWRYA